MKLNSGDWNYITKDWNRYWLLKKHNKFHVKVIRQIFCALIIDNFLKLFNLRKKDKILEMW